MGWGMSGSVLFHAIFLKIKLWVCSGSMSGDRNFTRFVIGKHFEENKDA